MYFAFMGLHQPKKGQNLLHVTIQLYILKAEMVIVIWQCPILNSTKVWSLKLERTLDYILYSTMFGKQLIQFIST